MNTPLRKTPPASRHWLDDPKHVRLLWRGFIAVLALTLGAQFVVDLHPAFALEAWFGFYAAFGFAACALMILAAKLLGFLIKRPDSYYARDDAHE